MRILAVVLLLACLGCASQESREVDYSLADSTSVMPDTVVVDTGAVYP